MTRFAFFLAALLAVSLTTSLRPVFASRPSDSLLPSTTKGYLSVANVDTLDRKWRQIQLGQLANDPVMKDFVEDFRRQLKDKLNDTALRLSLSMDDLKGVPSGELCLAMVQPDNDPKQHAIVVLLDITDHDKQAQELTEKVAQSMKARGAQKAVQSVDGVELTTYTVPKKTGETEIRRAFYFIREHVLVASDHEGTAKGILKRFAAESKDSLRTLPTFQATMTRCAKAPDAVDPDIRWFVDPFGYAMTARSAQGGRKKRGTDMLKVLANQGFTAVKGVGGHVALAVNGKEILHKTMIYAPAVNKTGAKYNLAMRMMNFPESTKPNQLAPQNWVPRDVSGYLTFNWRMKEAFEYSKTLVDEIAGAPVFDDIMESLERDPNGPRVDIRKGLIEHAGQRVMFFTDYRLPITPQSERWMLALEVTDPAVVTRTLQKAMSADPNAKQRKIGGLDIWEIVEEEATEVEQRKTSGPPGVGSPKKQEEDEEEEKVNPLLKHAALGVVRGYLLVASHVDFMAEVIQRKDKDPTLDKAPDYLAVDAALRGIGAGMNSFRHFGRTDKAYRPTYELIQQGKMPEAETLFGSLLNKWLGPEEEGVLREQQIDGRKLPDFEKVRPYLGPGGLFADTEDDGWFVAGCLLKTLAAEKPGAEDNPAKEATKPEATAKPK